MHRPLRDNSLLYHTTRVGNVSDIMAEGIIPSDSRNDLEKILSGVAAEHGITYPINRWQCVFLYPLFSQAIGYRTFDKEELEQGLGCRTAVILVDAGRIEQNLYLGDFTLFTEAQVLIYKTDDGSHEKVLREYAESLTQVGSLENLSEMCSQFDYPEIVVEGGVDPAAIVGCVLDDQYLTRLL